MIPIEYILFVGAGLVLVSIGIAKFSDNLGVPALLLFLGVGILAGSEGPGGIYFDDAGLAQSVGIVALIFILFAGGLDTNWAHVRPVLREGASLATVGVLLTALAVGVFAVVVLDMTLLNGLLLGAVISSTDAAAVFSVLRSRNVSLGGRLRPLLELESGSNDPMAVFLTVGLIQLLVNPQASAGSIALLFVVQMGLGGMLGLVLGKAMVYVLNRLNLPYEGIYPVFTIAFAALVYGVTASIGGSGFLAVYIAGIVAGNADFIRKRSLIRFFDGLAWMSQIAMFLTLGLLVFPSHIVPIIGSGVVVSCMLMFAARPLSVFIALSFSSLRWQEKAFVSWVGLRGAVPIILATFPLIAGVSDAHLLFNLVFFIVLTSALVQGWSIPLAARLLHVGIPAPPRQQFPIDRDRIAGADTELVDLTVPYNAAIIGKAIVELGLPHDSLIVLISRNDDYVVPGGDTVLQEGDTALVLVTGTTLPEVRAIFSRLRSPD